MCKCLSCHFKLPCKYINLEQYLFSTDLATESSPLDLFNAFSSIYCSPSFIAPLRGCQESTGQSSWQEVNDPRFSLLKHSPDTTCSFRSILKQALNFQVHETSSGCRLACHLSLYHTNLFLGPRLEWLFRKQWPVVGSSPSLSLQLGLLRDQSYLFKKLHTNLSFFSSKADEVLAE